MKSLELTGTIPFRKDAFRDSVATVDKEGNRKWIYPKKPKGKYTRYRTLVSLLCLTFFFAAPFIRIHDEPLILLNILERKFVLFGFLFRPQDFGLLAIGFITFMIFIVVFTMVYGRVFCGWVCPQTIFMEMVFRKIEYLIEGDWKSQIALDKAENSPGKFGKKFLKHSVFFIISFIISNTLLIYIISSEEWIKIISESPADHIGGLSSIIIFTAVFYWIYAKFREQVCTTVCPYGRLQGVLLDKKSIVVAYDYLRGENRGKIRKGENRTTAQKGDCIDCNQCVNVCPTGIDIRNGTQLECINCTACIDACNFMMEKVGLAQGLIRFDSEEGIAEGKKFRITPRIIVSSIVLCLLTGFFALLLLTRTDIQTSVLRTPGVLFQKEAGDQISNLYNIKIINKTNKRMPLELKVLSGEAQIRMVGKKSLEINEEGETDGVMFIVMKRKDIHDIKTKLIVGVYSDGRLMEKVKTTFIGPVN
jgi:cytochrome c oxidase accessory protein FixG